MVDPMLEADHESGISAGERLQISATDGMCHVPFAVDDLGSNPMPENGQRLNRESVFAKRLWILPILVYLGFSIPCAFWLRDSIHPDAVSYLQLSRYLAEGKVSASISGYWSPLLIWLIAPFQWLGMDGLHAGRLVMVGSGCLLLFSFHFFMRQFPGMSG